MALASVPFQARSAGVVTGNAPQGDGLVGRCATTVLKVWPVGFELEMGRCVCSRLCRWWTSAGDVPGDRDITASFPELPALAAAQGSQHDVLDGEIVALDNHGGPSFQKLQARIEVTYPARVRRLTDTLPVTFVVLDVRHVDGRSTLDFTCRQAS